MEKPSVRQGEEVLADVVALLVVAGAREEPYIQEPVKCLQAKSENEHADSSKSFRVLVDSHRLKDGRRERDVHFSGGPSAARSSETTEHS